MAEIFWKFSQLDDEECGRDLSVLPAKPDDNPALAKERPHDPNSSPKTQQLTQTPNGSAAPRAAPRTCREPWAMSGPVADDLLGPVGTCGYYGVPVRDLYRGGLSCGLWAQRRAIPFYR
ncbi:hypothetical protein PAXINDRAFT_103956 [Paxillus involutus ATCC 200175]|uniref:Uncharacterized protein n=1 Tax=Paxillus involutus ATCC 200175 TaxID=664439 RepID=A0A0C9TCF9_PAXIN|nr:hypothetical protein PAXINDRAFT_103956 [Paxillus involutus ATCC 200175]